MKTLIRLFYGAVFLAAGIAHFKRPNGFKAMCRLFFPLNKQLSLFLASLK
ncbi:hypothetical protein RG959_00615 [Domibacillus sp. 8LH]